MRVAGFALVALSTAWAQISTDVRPGREDRSSGTLTSRALTRQLERENTDERIKRYEKLVVADGGREPFKAGLIAAYLQKVRETADFTYLDRASRLIDEILARDGWNFAALRYRNEVDLQKHEFKIVAARAEMMVKDEPSDPGSWANLGDASMELGDYDKAGRAYLKMFALGPSLGSYNRLAYWRFVTGDGNSAVDLMEKAIQASEQRPENVAWCLAELGDMDFKLGRLSEAEKSYRSALDLFPQLHRALGGLGKLQAAKGEPEAAIRSYRQAQAVVPLVEYAGALEDLYAASGLPEKAAQQRQMLSLIEKLGRVTNEKTNRNLALVLADHDRDLDLALDLMNAELPVRGDVYTWDALSWVLLKKGRLSEAKAASANAVKLQTPEPLFYYHAREIASASGDGDAARSFARRLMSLNPSFQGAQTRRPSSLTQ
ncbi:MAG: tetratricopeptide repeat protein [Bryobacteraceae bacterium]